MAEVEEGVALSVPEPTKLDMFSELGERIGFFEKEIVEETPEESEITEKSEKTEVSEEEEEPFNKLLLLLLIFPIFGFALLIGAFIVIMNHKAGVNMGAGAFRNLSENNITETPNLTPSKDFNVQQTPGSPPIFGGAPNQVPFTEAPLNPVPTGVPPNPIPTVVPPNPIPTGVPPNPIANEAPPNPFTTVAPPNPFTTAAPPNPFTNASLLQGMPLYINHTGPEETNFTSFNETPHVGEARLAESGELVKEKVAEEKQAEVKEGDNEKGIKGQAEDDKKYFSKNEKDILDQLANATKKHTEEKGAGEAKGEGTEKEDGKKGTEDKDKKEGKEGENAETTSTEKGGDETTTGKSEEKKTNDESPEQVIKEGN